ncbi:hypothetical protein [Haloferula rosea]|uniref:Uncharacterized protein n=1 Tax=Haloferula rosea TaxID=490093 RepID=A0A934RB85_9BACT|nr:hypothetical protein [Haloferula rosea]MBK1826149.1 hypothetical protein [Haloferula rosea]
MKRVLRLAEQLSTTMLTRLTILFASAFLVAEAALPRVFSVESAKGVYSVSVESFAASDPIKATGGNRIREFTLVVKVEECLTGSVDVGDLIRIHGSQTARKNEISRSIPPAEGSSSWGLRGHGKLDFFTYEKGEKYLVTSLKSRGVGGIQNPDGAIYLLDEALLSDVKIILGDDDSVLRSTNTPGTSLRVEAALALLLKADASGLQSAEAAFRTAVESCEAKYLLDAAEVVSIEAMLSRDRSDLANLPESEARVSNALTTTVAECAAKLSTEQLRGNRMKRVLGRHRSQGEIDKERVMERLQDAAADRKELVGTWALD